MLAMPDQPQASDPHVAIVVSRYNTSVTDRLLEGAVEAHGARRGTGGTPNGLITIDAPGAFELPVLAMAAARRSGCRGVLTLGCVIRGETRHDQFISQAVANALQEIALRTGVPAAFGVVTTENAAQARARAGGEKGNKGEESMHALLDTIASLEALNAGNEARLGRTLTDKAGDH